MNERNISRRLALGALGATAASTMLPHARRSWAAESVNIGTLCPLTGAGSSFGGLMEAAVRRQIEWINEFGGVGGFRLNGVFENSETDPNVAVVAAKKLATVDKVSAILGEFASSETLAVSPICIENKILQFTSAGDDKIVEQDHNGYVFRTTPSAVLWGKTFAEAAWESGAKRAAIATAQVSYAPAYSLNFRNAFQEFGGEVVGTQVTYNTSAMSYRGEVQQILASEPEIVL